MGYVNVRVGGSFVGHFGIDAVEESFSALTNGHADAVARAIEYLASVVLPRATALDHQLHSEGAAPNKGFTPERILRPPDPGDPGEPGSKAKQTTTNQENP